MIEIIQPSNYQEDSRLPSWRSRLLHIPSGSSIKRMTTLDWARNVQGLSFREVRILEMHETLEAV